MFFDEGNSRYVRLLRETSHFLEACIEKLLVLEQEALSELRNKTDTNKKKGDNSLAENGDANIRPSTSNAVSSDNERTSLCDTENKSLSEPKEIRHLGLENSLPIIAPETSSKRKHEVSSSSTSSKKQKCDKMIEQSDEEVLNNCSFDEKLSNNDVEHSSEPNLEITEKEHHNSNIIMSENIKNVPFIASQKEQSSSSKL